MTGAKRPHIVIYEPGGSGHRLHYVRWIATALARNGRGRTYLRRGVRPFPRGESVSLRAVALEHELQSGLGDRASALVWLECGGILDESRQESVCL